MFCPNCKYEYKPGVATCPDCGTDLVYKLAPEQPNHLKKTEPQDALVTVFKSYDFAITAIAKSILEEAGIEYMTLGGRGRSGREFQVSTDKAEEARSLLAGIE
jgi:hypothetical protein